MSDHHARYFKGDGYEVTPSSSKRYHASGGLAESGSSSHYYEASDRDRKRSRTDYTGGSESHSYKDYTGTSGGPVYKSYYEGGGGTIRPLSIPSSSSALKSSADAYQSSSRREDYLPPSRTSKYIADLRGNTKTIRRIPPPPPPLTSYSKGSSSNMKPSTYFGESSHTTGHSSNYGSRIRHAPPEYHGKYSSSSRSFDDRKGRDIGGGFKPVYMNRVTGGVSNFQKFSSSRGNFRRNFVGRSSGTTSSRYDERRRATERAAASVSSKIRERERATSSRSYEKRRSTRRKEEDDDDIKTTTSKKDEDEKSIGKDAVDNMDESEVQDKEDIEGKVDEDNDNEKSEADAKIKVENGGEENADDENDKVEGEGKEKDSEEKSRSKSKSDSRSRDRSSKNDKDKLEDKDKTLLKLHCIYCDVKCISFREFTIHLRSFAHNRSMNSAVTDMRKKLSKLRNEQRDDQRKLEKKAGDTELSDTTSYCRVCELNFRTDPKEHEANELHNNIKTIIYQRCDICDIVYLYHMSALEHAKRVALKELALLGEGETVKGTNLSHEELGFDLVVEKTMLHCNACVRYIPIRDSKEETLNRHCMTLTHIKYVGEFRDKEKKYAERRKEEEERKLADIEKQKKKEEAENEEKKNEVVEGGEDLNGEENYEMKKEVDGSSEQEKIEEEEDKMDTENSTGQEQEEGDDDKGEEGDEGEGSGNEEEDQDEIELHAGDDRDVADDDDNDAPAPTWKRATRSSLRRTAKK